MFGGAAAAHQELCLCGEQQNQCSEHNKMMFVEEQQGQMLGVKQKVMPEEKKRK